MVDSGLYSIYNNTQRDMMKCAMGLKEKYPSSKMTVVGHSLGGALATLAVLDLNQKGYAVDSIYTYG